jgi:tRNA(Ile)-lysidine synthase
VSALSGGADSVALLDGLVCVAAEGGFRVVAAHLDHRLRPDSGADAAFCAELCARLGVPLRSGAADVRGRARREGSGIEDAARQERYAFLRQVLREEGAVAIAVAHTRDDQAETFLHRLLRGAGSLGLGAMRKQSGEILRPLLLVSREQVLAHLRQRGLAWREDPSNADPAFLRNRVRHELIPYLEGRFNPRARQALARAAGLLADEAEWLEAQGQALLEAHARVEGPLVVVERAALGSAPRALARRALRRALENGAGLRGVGAQHIEAILDIASAEAPSGKRLPLPGGREAVFSFDSVWLGPRRSATPAFSYPVEIPGRLDLPGGLRLTTRPSRGPAVSKEEMAVVALPEEPLVVRTRRPGDRVRAHGREMSLRRLMMDRRMPADLRGGLPLLAAGPRVLWAPGLAVEAEPLRGSERARFVQVEMERL